MQQKTKSYLKLTRYLSTLCNSGDGQQILVGDFLRNQIESGEFDGKLEKFLVTGAEELRDTAQAFVGTFGATKREFQVRIEDLDDGTETIECFSNKDKAESHYFSTIEKEHAREEQYDIAIELIEVLQQHRIEGRNI